MSLKKTNARIEKWRVMLGEGLLSDEELLKSRTRKGIPAAMRGLVWPQLIDLPAFTVKQSKQYTYQRLLSRPSPATEDISLDIPRTFPDEEDSRVLNRSLNDALKAVSLVHKGVGYCQGMNFLALRLLQVLDDEQSFWLLDWLLRHDPALAQARHP